MSTRRGWWRRVVVPLVVCAMSVAMAGVAVPSATAAPPGTVKTVPVQQLSNRVLKLIKAVEDSPLACETRNTVVRRLRLVDDALLSGRRSAAQAFALAWRQNAWSLESARVIPPGLGSALQTQLGGMVDQIGTGWSVRPGPTRHWKPLPTCGSSSGPSSGGGVAASSGYTPYAATDVSSDIEILVGALVSYVPKIGNLLYALTYLLWPAGSSAEDNTLQQMVDQSTYDLVATDLKGLGALLDDPATGWDTQLQSWQVYCEKNGGFDSDPCILKARGSLWTSFQSKVDGFTGTGGRPRFQQNESTDYRLPLLPLFAQFENLYMSLLHDGILLHKYWTDRTAENKEWVDLDDNMAANAMRDELNPNFTYGGVADRGIGYVNSIYKLGLDMQPSPSPDDWNTLNTYKRNMTLSVLDARDTWKYLDPGAYPDGVPGGVKLTRMIYSDTRGHPAITPNVPSNVAGPLKETSVWTRPIYANPDVYEGGTPYYPAIDSVQATSPPLLGPALSGAITGDTAQPRNGTPGASANYYNLSARGPIIEVRTQSYRHDAQHPHIPSWISYYWATGGHSDNGFACSTSDSRCGGLMAFQYDGEVVATAQALGTYNWDFSDTGAKGIIAASVVFGFRYADSFNPAGEVIGAGSGKCLDVPLPFTNGEQATIHSCAQPPGNAQIWTYDPGLQQISVTQPAADYKQDDTKFCLDAKDRGTTAGTAVVINPCDDGARTLDSTTGTWVTSSQRWTLDAVGGAAKITNVRSGLVIDVPNNSKADGTGLQLASYLGSTGQHWHASDPLTGEIHGTGSGRCLNVPNGVTTPGTQVQISQCDGSAAQQWTYNYKMLFYGPAALSLCLTARGGGTTAGTAVEINTCSGATEQKWTLHGDGATISNDKSGLVLDVTSGNTANGTLVQLYTANGGQGQHWSRTSTQGGALYSLGAGGQCLTSSGVQLAIAPCYSPPSQAQTWTYHPVAQTYTVNTTSGERCLDVADNGLDAALKVCTPEAASQRWARDFSYSTITNVNSGLVLDVSFAATTSGTVVLTPQARDAHGNPLPTPTQKWVWSLS